MGDSFSRLVFSGQGGSWKIGTLRKFLKMQRQLQDNLQVAFVVGAVPCGAVRFGGKRGIRTPGTVARTPHFECGPIDHSGTSPFRSREEGLPRSPDPKPLFWDCKYRHIFYFRTFSCGKNHIWLKKRLRRPCFCRFSGIIRIFDFVRRYARAAKCRQVCFCFRRFVSLQTDGPASRMQYFPCAAVYKEERY